MKSPHVFEVKDPGTDRYHILAIPTTQFSSLNKHAVDMMFKTSAFKFLFKLATEKMIP